MPCGRRVGGLWRRTVCADDERASSKLSLSGFRLHVLDPEGVVGGNHLVSVCRLPDIRSMFDGIASGIAQTTHKFP